MLLSTAFAPPVEYIALIANSFTLSTDRVSTSTVWIEACENYQKQSWRNRCLILGADGVRAIQIPVVHEGGTFKLPITRIKVDWSTPWDRQAEKTIATAYDASPYFEYYRDELFAIIDAHPETLFELNGQILDFFLRKTGIPADIRPTVSFSAPDGSACREDNDFRYSLHPKKPNSILADLGLDKPYWQVFSGRFGFTRGLSIMDLLFNEGPDSIRFLKKDKRI